MRLYRKVNGRFTPEDVEDIVRGAIASNRLEGMETSPEEAEMLRRLISGEISRDEHMAWLLSHVGVAK